MLDRKKLSCSTYEFAELCAAVINKGMGLRFTANGQSMHPLIRDGDCLWVDPVKPEMIRRGDVLLFVSPDGRAIVHRVRKLKIEAGTKYFLMQGDYAANPDAWASELHIIGLVRKIERNGVSFSMKSPLLRMLGILATYYNIGNPINKTFFKIGYFLTRQLAGNHPYLS